MNLVKKLFTGNSDHDSQNLPAGRTQGHSSRRFSPDPEIERAWRDLERDPLSIVRDPWSTLDRMSRSLPLGTWPAIDISEDERAMTVRCDVPGLDVKIWTFRFRATY